VIQRNETERKKTILMLSWEYPPHIVGGLARHVHALSIELVKRNYEIHVISSRPHDAPGYEKKDGVHIHRVAPLNDQDSNFISWIGGLNLAAANIGLSIARDTIVDMVHTHDWMTGPAAELISKSLEIPLAATIHGTEYGRNKGIYTELQQFVFDKEKALAHSSDKVIVCSVYMADEIKQLFGVPESKISVIPNGSIIEETGLPVIEVEEVYPFIKGKKLIFSIGRIVKEKGFETLIKAASMMKETYPDLCFVIAGNGPLLESYRQKVKHLSLEDSVYFIGFIQEGIRKGFLERADLTVFASLYEPFGLAAAEGLAAGKPTIIAQTGGLQGLAENLKTGFYMEPGNVKSLVDSIKFILANERLANEIALKGKLAVKEKFSWAKNAKATDDLYKYLLITHSCEKEGLS
jgi:glycogen synthase